MTRAISIVVSSLMLTGVMVSTGFGAEEGREPPPGEEKLVLVLSGGGARDGKEGFALAAGGSVAAVTGELAEQSHALAEPLQSEAITGNLSCSDSGDCGAPLIAVYELGGDVAGGEWPPTTVVFP